MIRRNRALVDTIAEIYCGWPPNLKSGKPIPSNPARTKNPLGSIDRSRRYGKYSPVKPGALKCEPLKAAGKAAYAAYTLIHSQGSGSRQTPSAARCPNSFLGR